MGSTYSITTDNLARAIVLMTFNDIMESEDVLHDEELSQIWFFFDRLIGIPLEADDKETVSLTIQTIRSVLDRWEKTIAA